MPPSGVLELTGPPLLRRVYSPDFSARYADGTPLIRQPEGDQVGFWCVKTEGGIDHFLVGTRAEYETPANKEDGPAKSSGAGVRAVAAAAGTVAAATSRRRPIPVSRAWGARQ